jgi:hypothetical protein
VTSLSKKWIVIVGVSISILGLMSAGWWAWRIRSTPLDPPVVSKIPFIPPVPVVIHGIVTNDLQVIQQTIQRNQKFADLFQGYSLSPRTLQ